MHATPVPASAAWSSLTVPWTRGTSLVSGAWPQAQQYSAPAPLPPAYNASQSRAPQHQGCWLRMAASPSICQAAARSICQLYGQGSRCQRVSWASAPATQEPTRCASCPARGAPDKPSPSESLAPARGAPAARARAAHAARRRAPHV